MSPRKRFDPKDATHREVHASGVRGNGKRCALRWVVANELADDPAFDPTPLLVERYGPLTDVVVTR